MFSTIHYLVITALLYSVVSSGSVDTAGVSAKFSLINGKLHSSRVRVLHENPGHLDSKRLRVHEDAFIVEFEFPSGFDTKYHIKESLFKNSFMEAAKLISDSIVIYSTININVVFKIFDAGSEILAQCAPYEISTISNNKELYLLHPRALIKHLPRLIIAMHQLMICF